MGIVFYTDRVKVHTSDDLFIGRQSDHNQHMVQLLQMRSSAEKKKKTG